MCIVPQSHFDENFAGLLHLVWATTAGPNSSYSTKIFLGGVPWDISEQTLVQVCSFVYMMSFWCFDISIQGDRDVIDLLSKYGQDKTSRDSFYYKICNTGGSRRMRIMSLNKSALLEFYP